MRKKQSFAGYVREKLPEIEQRLEVGIRQEVIVEEANAEGEFNTTLANFRNELVRARRWKAEKAASLPVSSSPANTAKGAPDPVTKEKPGQSFIWSGTAKDDSDVI